MESPSPQIKRVTKRAKSTGSVVASLQMNHAHYPTPVDKFRSPGRGRDRAPSSSPEEIKISADAMKQLKVIATKYLPRAQARKQSKSVSQPPVSGASKGSGRSSSKSVVTFPQTSKRSTSRANAASGASDSASAIATRGLPMQANAARHVSPTVVPTAKAPDSAPSSTVVATANAPGDLSTIVPTANASGDLSPISGMISLDLDGIMTKHENRRQIDNASAMGDVPTANASVIKFSAATPMPLLPGPPQLVVPQSVALGVLQQVATLPQ